MTFLNDGTGVVKMEYSEEETSAVLAESEQERKRLRKLGKVMATVSAYRLKEMKILQAVETLTIWRRLIVTIELQLTIISGLAVPLPLTPEQFTQSLWSELNALRDAISMPEGDRLASSQRAFLNWTRHSELDGCSWTKYSKHDG